MTFFLIFDNFSQICGLNKGLASERHYILTSPFKCNKPCQIQCSGCRIKTFTIPMHLDRIPWAKASPNYWGSIKTTSAAWTANPMRLPNNLRHLNMQFQWIVCSNVWCYRSLYGNMLYELHVELWHIHALAGTVNWFLELCYLLTFRVLARSLPTTATARVASWINKNCCSFQNLPRPKESERFRNVGFKWINLASFHFLSLICSNFTFGEHYFHISKSRVFIEKLLSLL